MDDEYFDELSVGMMIVIYRFIDETVNDWVIV